MLSPAAGGAARFRCALVLALVIADGLRLRLRTVGPGDVCIGADRVLAAPSGASGVPSGADVRGVAGLGRRRNFARADDFVDDAERFAKNLWATYVCVANDIRSGIVGMADTSKWLAVTIVGSHLFLKNRRWRGRKMPPLTYEAFICSAESGTEGLGAPLERVVLRAAAASAVGVLLFEEVGHADLSPSVPHKCVHSIIDGILIVRERFAEDAPIATAVDVFLSSARSGRQLNGDAFAQFCARSNGRREDRAHVDGADDAHVRDLLGPRDAYEFVREFSCAAMPGTTLSGSATRSRGTFPELLLSVTVSGTCS
jgi:hypothetical protein